MNIGNYKIKPIALHLTDEEDWRKQKDEAVIRFAASGVEDIYWLNGVHAKRWGIKGTHIYLLDGRPEEQYYTGDANVGNFISQYIAFTVMDALDYSHYLYLEGDCIFEDGWKEKLAMALEDIPPDFDMLYVGSCCCENKEAEKISERSGVHYFPYRGEEKWNYYPLCTHCYIVAKKAIPTLIETQRDVASPTDISLIRHSLPKLKVYAILPRLASQIDTVIPD